MARAAWMFLLAYFTTVASAEVLKNFGVNWGSQTAHPLPAKDVVQMLKANGIKKVKFFDMNHDSVSATANTGMEVMVGLPNLELKKVNDYENAKDWVTENVTDYLNEGVNIKYVAVGNEPFLKAYKNNFIHTTVPAMINVQKALNELGYKNKVKVVSPLNADVYESGSNKPSDGDWRPDLKHVMNKMVKFLKDNNSPFLVNIYPFLSLSLNENFPEDFAFFDGGGKTTNDNGYSYSNVFDANYDTLICALEKNGFDSMDIVVGEVGWPTDGHPKATIDKAEKFYKGLFKRLGQNKGTPRHPAPLEVYLFGLFDEDMKSVEPGLFERHWGIYTYDGKPKFPVDFSGQGRDITPVSVKGVKYKERKWCVYDPEAKASSKDMTKEVSYACGKADCSVLAKGGSCGSLTKEGNASYAFNSYFQQYDQREDACDFGGLAKIVEKDPSKGNCKFTLSLESRGERVRLGYGAGVFWGTVAALFMLL